MSTQRNWPRDLTLSLLLGLGLSAGGYYYGRHSALREAVSSDAERTRRTDAASTYVEQAATASRLLQLLDDNRLDDATVQLERMVILSVNVVRIDAIDDPPKNPNRVPFLQRGEIDTMRWKARLRTVKECAEKRNLTKCAKECDELLQWLDDPYQGRGIGQ